MRVSIFSNRLEKFNLGIGIFVVILSVFSLFLLPAKDYRSFHTPYVGFLFKIALLSLTHNSFNFMLPLVSPEVRHWWKDSSHLGLSTNKFMTLLFAFFFVTIFTLFKLIRVPEYRLTAMYAFIFLGLVLEGYHNLGQMYGFSRIYDQRTVELFGSSRKPIFLRFQRLAFTALLTLTLLGLSLSRLPLHLNPDLKLLLARTLFTLSVALVFLILVLARFEPHGSRSNKPLYLVRLFVFAFLAYGDPFIINLYFFVHSTEYTLLIFSMIRNSQQDWSGKTWILASSIPLFFVTVALTRFEVLGRPLARLMPNYLPLLMVLSAISFSLTFCHFFLDRLMFRMQDFQARRWIAPLISLKN